MITPADALRIIKSAFLSPPIAPPRISVDVNDGPESSRVMLAMPALRSCGISIVKIVTVRRGERAGLQSYLLALDQDGHLLAVIEAHQLTARRTAAASVLAAQAMGAAQSNRLAVLGAGRQAHAQVEAFATALPLKKIVIWARRKEAADDLAAFARQWPLTVEIADNPAAAVGQADIISCATASHNPLIFSADVAPGAHIDLVGGFRPDMREADDGIVARATVVADTAAALVEAGDLSQPIARGIIDPRQVMLLADLLAGKASLKQGDISLFKSVGHAAEDLVVTELLLERLGLLKQQGRDRPPSDHLGSDNIGGDHD